MFRATVRISLDMHRSGETVMARLVYVNGVYKPYSAAMVHVEDRAFQFSDAVYEVIEVRGSCLIDERLHLDRLHRSLAALHMQTPMSPRALGIVIRETIRRNRVKNGFVYLQITRGVARRDFAFPDPATAPTVVCLARHRSLSALQARAERGIKVISLPDIRWHRPDIKSTSLLANALARQTACEHGADEAWMTDSEGFVTEGTASNAWIVSQNGEITTRPAEDKILRGITRTVLIDLIDREGLTLVERPFTIEEAQSATEAFSTAATIIIMPVINIDNVTIGDGLPGSVTKRLGALFHTVAERSNVRLLSHHAVFC
jgi:D-alanine transaminase